MSDSEQTNRPSASGHRFGPDLSCSECGVTWDEHQKDPSPCVRAAKENAFEAQDDSGERPPLLSSAKGRDER